MSRLATPFMPLAARLVAVLAGLALVLAAVSVARAEVPTPKVTKMPSDKPGSPGRNYPFFATDIVLANYGYVEEEFSYEGTANTYGNAPLGTNAEITASGIPYKSRFLVRRPAQQSRFNGVVIVEWLNVTNQYDTDVLWLYQKEFFIREGYAWVGVSAQNAGLSNSNTGLKIWSPRRYSTLDVTNGGKVTGDALAGDIFSQAAAAIRRVPEVMGGMRTTYVIAAGQSQSAGQMGPYLNSVHSRDPIYDAALLTVNNQAMRGDLTIPVIKVLSETERNSSASQPDLAKVRVWNVAGSTHSEQYSLLSRAAFLMRDLNLKAVDTCATPARSRVEIRYVFNAAIDALVQWKKTGKEPAHAPGLEFDEALRRAAESARAAGAGAATGAAQPGVAGGRGARGAGRGAAPASDAPATGVDGRGAAAPADGQAAAGRGARGGGAAPGGGRGGGAAQEIVKRDERGNILGGIRLAEIAVPVAKESGELCGLGGTHVPFEAEVVNRLYPTHNDYVAKVTKVAQDLVKSGFMLQADAAQTIDKAKRSIWGLQLTCGPLCADVRQFPSSPSSQLLANQTSFLMIKDGDSLVKILDAATKLIAEGYTLGADPKAKKKFTDAAAAIQTYVDRAKQLAAKGNMPPETLALLVDQGTTLKDLVEKQGS